MRILILGPKLVPGGGVEPPRPEGRRILSSTVGSERLGKFSTLLYFSTGYQKRRLHRYDPIRRVLNMELLQFYDSVVRQETRRHRRRFRQKSSSPSMTLRYLDDSPLCA